MCTFVERAGLSASTRSSAPRRASCETPLGSSAWVESVSEGKRARSSTTTRLPARASTIAAADPAQRAPTMTASARSIAARTPLPRRRDRALVLVGHELLVDRKQRTRQRDELEDLVDRPLGLDLTLGQAHREVVLAAPVLAGVVAAQRQMHVGLPLARRRVHLDRGLAQQYEHVGVGVRVR